MAAFEQWVEITHRYDVTRLVWLGVDDEGFACFDVLVNSTNTSLGEGWSE